MIQMIFKIIFPTVKSPRKGSGESKKVTTEMAVSLKETFLPAMLLRYELIDIYNTDEFRLFYKDLKLTSNLTFPRVTLLMWQQSKAQIADMAVRNAISERINGYCRKICQTKMLQARLRAPLSIYCAK